MTPFRVGWFVRVYPTVGRPFNGVALGVHPSLSALAMVMAPTVASIVAECGRSPIGSAKKESPVTADDGAQHSIDKERKA